MNLIEAQDARDKQRRVGPSNLSNPCSRCLANDLLGVQQPRSPFIMGAKIGTAIHLWLETLVKEREPTWESEQKVHLGRLGSYGPVSGLLDLYVPEERTIVDFKTTTRAKIPGLMNEFQEESPSGKVQAYIAQTHLYALGAENAGKKVDRITIVFIPRDSVTTEDIRMRSVDYDRDYALHVWDRARRIWEWLEEGGDPADLESDPECFICD